MPLAFEHCSPLRVVRRERYPSGTKTTPLKIQISLIKGAAEPEKQSVSLTSTLSRKTTLIIQQIHVPDRKTATVFTVPVFYKL